MTEEAYTEGVAFIEEGFYTLDELRDIVEEMERQESAEVLH